MIPSIDLNDLNRQIEAWYKLIAEVQHGPLADEPRQLLEQAVAEVRRGQAELNAAYPAEAAAFKQRVEAVEQLNAENLAQADVLQRRLAELKVAPVAPAAPPVALPSRLGPTLREELLARYFPKSPAGADKERVDEGSIAKHWDETDVPAVPASPFPLPPISPPHPDAPPQPDTPTQPPKKTKRIDKGGDAWEDLSEFGD